MKTTSKLYERTTMEVSHKQDNSKKKRLHARTFLKWHMSQAKKHKVSGDAKAPDVADNLETSCSKEGHRKLESCHVHCKKQRIDSEVKSLLGKGEAILEKLGSCALEV